MGSIVPRTDELGRVCAAKPTLSGCRVQYRGARGPPAAETAAERRRVDFAQSHARHLSAAMADHGTYTTVAAGHFSQPPAECFLFDRLRPTPELGPPAQLLPSAGRPLRDTVLEFSRLVSRNRVPGTRHVAGQCHA